MNWERDPVFDKLICPNCRSRNTTIVGAWQKCYECGAMDADWQTSEKKEVQS